MQPHRVHLGSAAPASLRGYLGLDKLETMCYNADMKNTIPEISFLLNFGTGEEAHSWCKQAIDDVNKARLHAVSRYNAYPNSVSLSAVQKLDKKTQVYYSLCKNLQGHLQLGTDWRTISLED